jgi:hypothetical protein
LIPPLRRELQDNLVFPDEVQFPADEILDHLRIVLQAVDGAGQPGVFRGQTSSLLLHCLALLPQAVNPVQALVTE